MSNIKIQMPNEIQRSKSIHSDIHDSKGRHSCECRNPGKHWIPDQARNDKLDWTYVVMYKIFDI